MRKISSYPPTSWGRRSTSAAALLADLLFAAQLFKSEILSSCINNVAITHHPIFNFWRFARFDKIVANIDFPRLEDFLLIASYDFKFPRIYLVNRNSSLLKLLFYFS